MTPPTTEPYAEPARRIAEHGYSGGRRPHRASRTAAAGRSVDSAPTRRAHDRASGGTADAPALGAGVARRASSNLASPTSTPGAPLGHRFHAARARLEDGPRDRGPAGRGRPPLRHRLPPRRRAHAACPDSGRARRRARSSIGSSAAAASSPRRSTTSSGLVRQGARPDRSDPDRPAGRRHRCRVAGGGAGRSRSPPPSRSVRTSSSAPTPTTRSASRSPTSPTSRSSRCIDRAARAAGDPATDRRRAARRRTTSPA